MSKSYFGSKFHFLFEILQLIKHCERNGDNNNNVFEKLPFNFQ